jgi:ParB family chromosome partitioning protein
MNREGQKRQALGRGLSALLPPLPATPPQIDGAFPRGAGQGVGPVPIEEIHPAQKQPRRRFDTARLDELAESIRSQGIIQPLVVRVRGAGGYELIAGERRWRAAQRAGLHDVPVLVREATDGDAFELALVENLQREDLNPIEQAEGFQRLMSEFGYTQETLAGRVGKDRSSVSNALRLLRLPPKVQDMVAGGTISMGHARALLGLEDTAAIERLALRIAARGLSVRQVEALVRREREGAEGKAEPARPSPAVRDLTERLQRALGTKVRLVETGEGRGTIEIRYQSLDQLDAVLVRILK